MQSHRLGADRARGLLVLIPSELRHHENEAETFADLAPGLPAASQSSRSTPLGHSMRQAQAVRVEKDRRGPWRLARTRVRDAPPAIRRENRRDRNHRLDLRLP